MGITTISPLSVKAPSVRKWLRFAEPFLLLLIVFAAYWLCLRFLFPGYFSPLQTLHSDFYDYAGMHQVPWRRIIQYPRPVAFGDMKLLGAFGLTGTMLGLIAQALASLVLVFALVRRLFGKRTWIWISCSLFCLLLLAHPDFYFDHRQDLPALLSLDFLLAGLLLWLAWIRSRRLVWLIGALVSIPLFAFTKESFFVSAPCLVGMLLLLDRPNRKHHAAFLGYVLANQLGSILWSRHIHGPFVDPAAAADAPYHISLAALDLIRTFGFYIHHAFPPAVAVWTLLGLYAAYRQGKKEWLTALGLVVAGVVSYLPLSVLPNHKVEEYSWTGVPLFLAPCLLLGATLASVSKKSRTPVFVALAVLMIWTGADYRRGYNGWYQNWQIEHERMGGNLVRSFDRLEALPASARVLLGGVDTSYLPWSSPDFMRSRFGTGRKWTGVVRPSGPAIQSDPNCRLATARFVRLNDFDYLAAYRFDGQLERIIDRSEFGNLDSDTLLKLLVPELAIRLQQAEQQPEDYSAWMDVVRACEHWGLWETGQRYLARAKSLQGSPDPQWDRYAARFAAVLEKPVPASLVATPLVPDQRGLGEITLRWSVPPQTRTELHLNTLDGPLVALGKGSGSFHTGWWAKAGMQFYLQDRTEGRPLQPEFTLARLVVFVPPSLVATPLVPDQLGLGVITLRWTVPPGTRAELHLNTPDGPLVAMGKGSGSCRTGRWAKAGMQFFLQDTTAGRPLRPEFTLARLVVQTAPRER